MIDRQELLRWLHSTSDICNYAIDEGGLTLIALDMDNKPTGAYLEIGGVPTQKINTVNVTPIGDVQFFDDDTSHVGVGLHRVGNSQEFTIKIGSRGRKFEYKIHNIPFIETLDITSPWYDEVSKFNPNTFAIKDIAPVSRDPGAKFIFSTLRELKSKEREEITHCGDALLQKLGVVAFLIREMTKFDWSYVEFAYKEIDPDMFIVSAYQRIGV